VSSVLRLKIEHDLSFSLVDNLPVQSAHMMTSSISDTVLGSDNVFHGC